GSTGAPLYDPVEPARQYTVGGGSASSLSTPCENTPSASPSASLGTRLPLRLVAYDLTLFRVLPLGLRLLLPAAHALGRTGGVLALSFRRRLVRVQDVLLTPGPRVGGDPVHERTHRHHEPEETEEGRQVQHELLGLHHRVVGLLR